MCKALSYALCPTLVASLFQVSGTVVQTAVVIDNDFCRIGITFAWHQYIGTGIFQHRHQERQYIALCVQVFYCLEDTGTLPFPTVQLWFIIPTMTLPQGDVTVQHTAGWSMWSRQSGNQRLGYLRIEGLCLLVFFAKQCLRNQFLHATLVSNDLYLMLGEFCREQGCYSLIDFSYVIFTERIVRPIVIGKQLQSFSVHRYRVNLYTPHRNFLLCKSIQIVTNLLTDVL